MTIFFIKSLLALLLLITALISVYTMLEVFGRGAAAASIERFRRLHKISGGLFITLFAFVTYLCIGFLYAAKSEPTPRAALHILLAYSLIALFGLKSLFIRIYRQFYGLAKNIGVIIAVVSFVMIGISAGHYLIVSGFGRDRTIDKSVYYSLHGPFLVVKKNGGTGTEPPRTDAASIGRGRTLFQSRCASCHDPDSTAILAGPGLKGLFRNGLLPVSRRPATVESVRSQLRQPLDRMPAFTSLTDDEISDLIAYLNSL